LKPKTICAFSADPHPFDAGVECSLKGKFYEDGGDKLHF
jgi:hypothetical protein